MIKASRYLLVQVLGFGWFGFLSTFMQITWNLTSDPIILKVFMEKGFTF